MKKIKETAKGTVVICRCSAQEFFECGGMGLDNCPGSGIFRTEVLPENARKSNVKGCYWVEDSHL